MNSGGIEVIATTISGSIKDWGKIERIEPLFHENGRDDVTVHSVNSHVDARKLTRELLLNGARTLISAGGSGTFNSVLEGCLDSQVGLTNITLGFLRKGSADLIGKTLGMPDDIDEAIKVFVTSLAEDRTVPCDVIEVTSGEAGTVPRHLVGYGGTEIFGRIPHFTENRFIKYYKGVLGQLFGDLGPFFVGASLATLDKVVRRVGCARRTWIVSVDGSEVTRGAYQAVIIVNGDLGSDLPFARSAPLGSGYFHMFAIRDLGWLKIPRQFKHAWNMSMLETPEQFGFESYRVERQLKLETERGDSFPANVDGSTMVCKPLAAFQIIDQIQLISRD